MYTTPFARCIACMLCHRLKHPEPGVSLACMQLQLVADNLPSMAFKSCPYTAALTVLSWLRRPLPIYTSCQRQPVATFTRRCHSVRVLLGRCHTLTSIASCEIDTLPPASLASSMVAGSGSKPLGQAHTNSKSNLAARRIQECTMLLPSPTYTTCSRGMHL